MPLGLTTIVASAGRESERCDKSRDCWNDRKKALLRALGIESLRTELERLRTDGNRYLAERDQLLRERERGVDDLLRDKMQSVLIERDAYREQRDQAFGEMDDLCRERNALKGEIERLRR